MKSTSNYANTLVDILTTPSRENITFKLISALESLNPENIFPFYVNLFTIKIIEAHKIFVKPQQLIGLFSKACFWIFRHSKFTDATALLKKLFKRKDLAPGAQLVLSSYLSVISVKKKIKLITVVSIYNGQIALMKPGLHALAEDALHTKISQFEDLYGINNNIEWGIIFIDDGDDRNFNDNLKFLRTSRIIYHELKKHYPEGLKSGKYHVIEMTQEVRHSIKSFQGGAIIYGLHKAMQFGAEIVFYTNIDLDSHVGLQGILLRALSDESTQIAIGSNRIKGSYIQAAKSYYIYSIILNFFVRMRLPIGKLLDTHNSFKGFRIEALKKVIPMTKKGSFDMNMDYFFSFPDMLLARARILNIPIKEVAVAMHRTAPLKFLPSIKNGLKYFKSVWNQGTFLKIWLKNKYEIREALHTHELLSENEPIILEVRDIDIFNIDKMCKFFRKERDFFKVQDRLGQLFSAYTKHKKTFKRLDVLRKVLSTCLNRPDSKNICEFLKNYQENNFQNFTVNIFIDSFLTIFNIKKPLRIATVFAIGRIEDAARAKYLHFKITQLNDLYSTNQLLSWQLIIVEECRSGLSIENWHQLMQETFPDLLLRKQVEFIQVPQVKVESSNWFKGGSILTGMEKALKAGNDYAIFTDAKPAIDLGQEGVLLKHALDNNDSVIIGSRYLPGSSLIRCKKRRFASRIYNKTVRIFLPHLANLHDTQCGFKCFSHSALSKMFTSTQKDNFPEYFDKGLSFDTELISNSILKGFHVKEIPIVSIWPFSESWRFSEAIKMVAGLYHQRQRLPVLQYIGEGKNMIVYLDREKDKVIKIIRNKKIIANDKQPIKSSESTKTDSCHKIFTQIFCTLINHQKCLSVIKWFQTNKLIRRIFFKVTFLRKEFPYFDLKLLGKTNLPLPGDVFAPFNLHKNRIVFLKTFFGKRLKKCTFVEQKAVSKFLESELKKISTENNISLGIELIDSAFALQEKMWRYGYFNKDINILNDTGIDENGTPILVDIGDLTQDYNSALKVLKRMDTNIFHNFSVESIRQYSPILANYYQEVFLKIFSIENFKKNWNMNYQS